MNRPRPSYSPSQHTFANKLARMAWGLVWMTLYWPSPRILHGWRRLLLRLFGAKIGYDAHPCPGARIWAPWNLELGSQSSLADGVDCYCVDRLVIGNDVTISQYAFLCTASHDYTDERMPLVTAPIRIGDRAWICADVFIGPGVTIGEGTVVGARSSVYRDLEPWIVAAGNPARPMGRREIREIAP